MQKVRSYYYLNFLLELLIKLLFYYLPSRYYSLSLIYHILALEEGSPLIFQTDFSPFYLLI